MAGASHPLPRPRRTVPGISPAAAIDERLTIWAIWLFCLGGGFAREVLGQTEVVGLGFYTFHSVDPALLVSAFAAVGAVWRNQIRWTMTSAAAVLMATLITFNFVRGMANDSASALLWLRANGGIATLLLLAVSVRPSARLLQAARKSLMWTAALLSGLIVLRLAFGPTLFMTNGISAELANDGGRALSVVGPFLMILASGILLSEMLARRRFTVGWRDLPAVALPMFILATRQGTASIAELCVLLIIFVMQRGPAQRDRALIGIIIVGFALLLYLAVLPLLADNQDLTQRASNLETRRGIWAALMTMWPGLPLRFQIFGVPAGQALNIYVYRGSQATEWTASIHSMYFGALPMMGYVGALAWIALLTNLILASYRRMQNAAGARPSCALAFSIATAILSYSYEVRGEELIGIVMAIWWINASSSTLGKGIYGRRKAPRNVLT